ncbi:E3 ubiquitin-protein ligase MIB2-like [Antedon mediterranea]|uniref:E3 ubiquitin-protein ligase MIB2-like n=1 Tax=Antedon mediterranea TaxID=105859 RepID=UPI003AF68197
MLKSPKVDISVSNGRGFNTLQYAALRGCTKAVELILSQTEGKQLVNSKKKDGFTALHVAAVNDHVEVAKLLIQKGKADLEIKNNKGATPLMCAVDEFHVKVVGVLVEAGSNVNCTDNDGDTCLHNLMIKNTINDLQGSLSGEDDIMRSLRAVVGGILNTHSESKPDDGFDIAGYLVANGANLQLKNKKGKTALDLNKNPKVEKMLLLVQQQQWQQSLK